MKSIREHQAQVIQPLVITPSPFKGESLPGFILRTAELNGYDSPLKLLHYAGMDGNEIRSARPSLEKLAPLFGKTVEEFRAFELDSTSKSKGRYVEIMGHNIYSIFTSCKRARVCLECVREFGYIDGFHELKFAVACPKHHIKTITSCPVCHKPLSWQRKGLNKCNCSAELDQFPNVSIADPAVIALLNVLYAKLMKQSLHSEQLDSCGFPREAIEGLTIQTLLSIIHRFGFFSDQKDSVNFDCDMRAIETTAKVFSNWPHNFHDYLDDRHGSDVNFNFSGLRAQFNSFYESFFKNIVQNQELDFMREAFISFGQVRWKKATIHPSFVPHQTSTLIGINSLSEKIKKHPHTIRKLVNDGLIKAVNINPRRSRFLFDESDQQQFEFAQGKSLSIKNAAGKLDLPVEILRAYRARGFYQARHLAAPIALFHERDVKQMHEDLIKDCQLYKISGDKTLTTLAQVMRMKFTAEIKAMFISEVMKRKIVPLGILDEKPSGLVFDKLVVSNLLHQISESLQGSISFQQATNILKITRGPLLSLIRADLLLCQFQNNTLRIDEKSVLVFHEQI